MVTTMTTRPKLATLHVEGSQVQGVQTQVRARNFELTVDEPKSMGGTDTGPNPMEYVLVGLVGCASVMLRMVAGEQGLDYTSADFDIRGTIDTRGLEGVEGVRRDFQTITGTVRVGTDDAGRLAQVVATIENRCPALNMLKQAGVNLDIDWVPQQG